MDGRFWYHAAALGLLVVAIIAAGCSDEQAQPAVQAPPTTAAPVKYSAGDIIARPSQATSDACVLILGYDRAADQYERAWVYRNPDGNFGFRTDNRSERSPRITVEKVYTVKLSHVTASSIPVATPTAVAVVTTASGNAPSFSSVSPATASKDSTVSVTITGNNFRDGATVKLIKPGFAPVKANAVSVVSPVRIDCTFSLAGLGTGRANIIVTNPDGQSVSAPDAFSVEIAGPVITSVSPAGMKTGETKSISIYGQNFQELSKIWISQGTAELVCTGPLIQDTSRITCDLAVPASAKTGTWNLSVINIADQQTGIYAKPFTITNST